MLPMTEAKRVHIMNQEQMTTTERRAAFSLAGIYSFRMLGLFMILPVFALYAQGLVGATPALCGQHDHRRGGLQCPARPDRDEYPCQVGPGRPRQSSSTCTHAV